MKIFVMAALACAPAFAQMTVTGSIGGSVMDPSGKAIPAAKLVLTDERTREIRAASTNDTGSFSFVAISPSTYTLKIEHPGFKAFERTGIVLSANERVALGEIPLQVGAVNETVSVSAEAAHVETDSAESSADITTDQVGNLTARGRDVVSLLRTIPGVAWQADQDSAGGSYGTSSPSIRGANSSQNIMAVDGVVSNDMGTPNVFSSVTTMDAIGEVKVILNGYRAEYAGNGGTIMQVVSKSGGREYHGNVYWYVRNDALNANDFFNNRNSVKRPEYRYNTNGATFGGPIYVPGHWNRDRNKLFGFYNIEQLNDRIPSANISQYNMPTALERKGDFSQSFAPGGSVIPVRDPLNNKTQFPGNVVPASRLDPNGVILLNILPLPNFVNPAITGYNYNYQIQEVQVWPKRSQLFKIDYVPRENDRIWVRGKTWLSTQQGYSVAAGATPVGFFAQCYCFSEEGLATGWTHVFSPSVVSEFNAGVRRNHEGWKPYNDAITPAQNVPEKGNLLSTVTRSAIGYTAGQWYPSSNPDNIIPRYSFNVQDSPNVSFDDRFLKNGTDFTFNLNDNITWIKGRHTVKFGGDVYRIREYEGERSKFDSTINFSTDANNPLDSNYSFANAALGNFNSYTESNARYGANERQAIAEWFVQDTWKVTRRLTLDYGMRWTWANQMYPHYAGQQSVLALGRYNPAQAPALYAPVLVNGVRMAQDPISKALLPQVYVGDFVPGTGNPADGGVTSGDPNYPRGFVNQQPVHWGPRFGFAWDVFGNGKTAVRAGLAILYNPRFSVWSPTTENPPAILTPITYYGSLSTFTQTAGVLAPNSTNAFNVNSKTPRNYNGSFGIQQDLGKSFLLDLSYATVLGRDIMQSRNINTVPYGAQFQHLDPTKGTPLADTFFEPYPGYAGITYYDNAYTSNYHALLLNLTRRFANGFSMGVAYAWSKYMDYTGIPVYANLRSYAYGLDGADQTHNMSVNFVYNVPKATSIVHNRLIGFAFDSWTLSGIGQFAVGTPAAISFSTVNAVNLNGGGDPQRVDVVGDAYSGNVHTFNSWFNPAAFALPGMNDPGNAGKYDIRQPGINNIDMALAKNFPLKNEKRYFEFRWEAYNTFNHTQYAGVNTAAKFSSSGAQTNALFGQVTSTRAPRVMQGSLRFTF